MKRPDPPPASRADGELPVRPRLLTRLLMAVAMLGVSILIGVVPVLRSFEFAIYDWRVQKLLPIPSTSRDIVVIGIDDESLERMGPAVGRWPWPRFVHSMLVQYCDLAKTIAFDVLFLERQWKLWTGDPGDTQLVESVRESEKVILTALFVHESSVEAKTPALTRSRLVLQGDGSKIESYEGVLSPFEDLLEVATGVGHSNLVRDMDGKMRRYLALLRYRDQYYPSLALSVVQHFKDLAGKPMQIDRKGRLHAGEHAVRVDADGTYHFRPMPGHFVYYSAVDVVESLNRESEGKDPLIPRAAFADKLVLIGITATGVRDHEITPLSEGLPGILITASVVQNLLSGVSLRIMPSWSEFPIMSILALLVTVPWLNRPRWFAIFGGAVIVLYMIFALNMALQFHVMVPVVGPVLTIVLSSAGIGCLYWNRERSRRRYVEALDEAKQQFTDMLVHDLKNTMAPVSMLLSSVRSKFGSAASNDLNFWTNDFQKTVYSSTKRLTTQINALLDVRRMAEGRLQLDRRPASISALVTAIGKEFEVVMEQSDLSLDVHCAAPDDLFVSVDTAVFDRVVGNLMWNAVKYSRTSSTIELGTRSDSNGHAICYVSNEGRIIPPDEQEKLFAPFFTGISKNRNDSLSSTGLGLTFCKLAVEAHGGIIEMVSPRSDQTDGVEVRVLFEVVEC